MGHDRSLAQHRRMEMVKLNNPDTYKTDGFYEFESVTGRKTTIAVGQLVCKDGYYSPMVYTRRGTRHVIENRMKYSAFEILEHSIDKHGVVRAKRESGKLESDRERWAKAEKYNFKAMMLSAGLVNILNGKIVFEATPDIKDCTIPKLIESAPLGLNGCRYTVESLRFAAQLSHIPTGFAAMCTKLCSVYWPENLKEIGNRAFFSCGFTELEFPSTLKSVGNLSFADNSKLVNVEFSGPLFYLGERAFYRCVSLKSIRIPNGISEIKAGTFAGCISLKNVFIPKSVNKVHPEAFFGVSANVKAPLKLKECLSRFDNLNITYY